MKQLEINFGKATILALGCRMDKGIVVDLDNNIIHSSGERLSYLPAGKWSILGFLNDLTEEQAMSVMPVKSLHHESLDDYYAHYKDELIKLLQSKGVITVNPYPKPVCDNLNKCTCDGMYIYECRESFLKWQTAQSQLWENVLILKKDE
jgi:hypothetical protein